MMIRSYLLVAVWALITTAIALPTPGRPLPTGGDDEALPAAVQLVRRREGGSTLVSGVAALSNHTILTARHCVTDAGELIVLYPDGQSARITRVTDCAETDVVALTSERDWGFFLEPVNPGILEIDDILRVVRCTNSGGLEVSEGRISGQDSHDDPSGLIGTAQVSPGWSGSAAVDSSGRLIGVAVASWSGSGNETGVAVVRVSTLDLPSRKTVSWADWKAGRPATSAEYSRLVSDSVQSFIQGDYEGQFRQSLQALLLQDDHQVAFTTLLLASMKLGKNSRFSETFERALAKWPNSKPLLMYAGRARAESQSWEAAAGFFERARAVQDGPVVRFWLGYVSEANDRAKAIDWFSRSLDLDPGFGFAYQSLYRMARPEVAGDEATLALLHRADSLVHVIAFHHIEAVIRILVRAGHVEEARRAVEKMRDQRPYAAARLLVVFPVLRPPE